MNRLTLAQLDRICQKPDHRTLGTWMARRVGRPAALRVTWLLAPWSITAHQATLAAWLLGLAACAALAHGPAWSFLLGAALLQVAFVADHVDGQLARLRRSTSLDGAQLDYLMHHTLTWCVPLACGVGLWRATATEGWLFLGTIWAGGAQLVALEHDTRWKAFEQRLKRLHGELRAVGGGGGRPARAALPASARGWLRFVARKAIEGHVVMNVLSLLALIRVTLIAVGQEALAIVPLTAYLTLMALLAPLVAVKGIADAQRASASEQAFAAWFRPANGDSLKFRDGWWHVDSHEPSGDMHIANVRHSRRIA